MSSTRTSENEDLSQTITGKYNINDIYIVLSQNYYDIIICKYIKIYKLKDTIKENSVSLVTFKQKVLPFVNIYLDACQG